MTLFRRAKHDKGNKGEATAAAEDVVQRNKDQATIETTGRYDAGYLKVAASYDAGCHT
jgi:hypothetical protein